MIYKLHNDGTIKAYFGETAGWQTLDNNSATKSIAANSVNTYQLHNDGKIWRYTGIPITGWEMIDNDPATTTISATSFKISEPRTPIELLYKLYGNGTIKMRDSTTGGWVTLDTPHGTTAIVARGLTLCKLQNDGQIWMYTGVPPLIEWRQLDINTNTKAITANRQGLLFQLHTDGTIWRFTGTPITGWEKIDINPATTAILTDENSRLYQLRSDGTILLFMGTPITGWKIIDNDSGTKAIFTSK